MHSKIRAQDPYGRRAAVMVQTVVFGGMVGIGMAALAIDTGLMYSARQELQSAADSAALAAASQLSVLDNALVLAKDEASKFSNLNNIMGQGADLVETDLVFGHALLKDNDKFDFLPNQQPYDAVRVTLRRDQAATDGPVTLMFAKALGVTGARMQASATAMLVPRDIALVIDLSGSMNDDSELQHYQQFYSETEGMRDGVQINMKDIWGALPINKGVAGIQNGQNPPAPGAPGAGDDQPATGDGQPQVAGGAPDAAGPRWGWMTGFGNPIILDEYDPVGDPGLYHIPKGNTCSDPDVISNLAESGYTEAERSVLLSGQYDNNSTLYRNRVRVLLGLAGWSSGKGDEAKYSANPTASDSGQAMTLLGSESDDDDDDSGHNTLAGNGSSLHFSSQGSSLSTFVSGNGDDVIDSFELVQQSSYPFQSGSWNDYINYVRSNSSKMKRTNSDFKYRYGIKTFVNYLLEKRAKHSYTPELVNTPEEPLHSVKGAVQTMITEIVSLQTRDFVSLETFGQYGSHEMNLTIPGPGQTLSEVLQEIPDTLYARQAGHETSLTNIGAGLNEAINELSSDRARTAAAKVIILLTDGKPNVDESNVYVGNNHPGAITWVQDRADLAKAMGITIYSIGVGGDVNADLCTDIATTPGHYYFADNHPDPSNQGLPLYVNQLREIFQTLGGKRTVRLIQ
ncbi:MAG: VWA domain-containing protein [Phycisphaerales bacterium]|nr:VWA domain-containing protein [Phycisphaerales bacterium]